MPEEIIIRPQPGRQEDFLSTSADIAIYGGAKGGGKTYALLLEPLRYSDVMGFNGTIFRRTKEQIRNTGALWDSASEIYSLLDAELKETTLDIKFDKMKLKFSHLEYEKDKTNWDGAQICYLGFDELQLFTETQFWYLVGSNRSTCGVRPYIRATCMADAGSWVKKLVMWWLDANGEYADPKKSGRIRWLVRREDEIYFADTKAELQKRFPEAKPMSITFIPSSVMDNKILLEKNPGYLANLEAMTLIERERKMKGNWKIKPQAGMFFKREYFEIVQAPPATRRIIRFWDRAATEKTAKNDPCWTAGVKMSRDQDGYIYIEHVSRFQASVFKRDQMIKNVASMDSKKVLIGLEQEPGASGVAEVQGLIKMLSGYNVRAKAPHKDKVTRALPFSAQCEGGNVKIVRGPWNDAYLTELENFDGDPKHKMDQVDASSGAFEMMDTANVVTEQFNAPPAEVSEKREMPTIGEDFRGKFGGRDRMI
jgi:predicted phage terminase large subunit-like protein